MEENDITEKLNENAGLNLSEPKKDDRSPAEVIADIVDLTMNGIKGLYGLGRKLYERLPGHEENGEK